ncbi:MAG: TIGR03435 family protein, partial [Candidatus Saccharimonadales bacterium]
SPVAYDLGAISTPIKGAPDWANSERFTISAEVPTPASKEMMMGPMMQSLLEERFKLKIHIETREAAAYDLVVAKGGPKLGPAEGAVCRMPVPADGPAQPADLPRCTMNFKSISMADLAEFLDNPILGAGRPVIDKTGITGKYDVRLVWALDPEKFRNLQQDANLPTLPEALNDQLGLKLVPSKGSAQTIFIDHIEEPSPN